jgi:hypothetical protein
MIEVAVRIVHHPEPLHHGSRAAVFRHREGNHLGQTQPLERESQALEAGFRGEAVAPARPLEAPADLHARREVGLERRSAQAHEANECPACAQLQCPQPPPLKRSVMRIGACKSFAGRYYRTHSDGVRQSVRGARSNALRTRLLVRELSSRSRVPRIS